MNKIFLIAAMLFSVSAMADRPSEERASEKREARQTLIDATTVYKALVQGAKSEVPASVVAKAKCVAVFPNVVDAAVVVGGAHGDGVATCKTAGTTTAFKWNSPAFVDVSGASLGLQVGGRSSDIVLFFMDEEAAKKLRRGTFKLGADASVVAGQFEKGVEIPAKGVIAYAQSEGAFIGASITGVNLGEDKESMKNYYGNSVEYASLLEGRITPSTIPQEANSFISLLPNA